MIVRILTRRDTALNWQASNPILGDGEVGLERVPDGTFKMKIGDGVRQWTNLPYSVASLNEFNNTVNQINQTIQNEQDARNTQITQAVGNEAQARQSQIQELNNEIQNTNNVLAGVHTTTLAGAMLTRVIGGSTQIAKNLFNTDTVFMAGKTLINDISGTLGVYIQDIDNSTIEIITKTISPTNNYGILLGSVDKYIDLPINTTQVYNKWGINPKIGDFVRIENDEGANNLTTERDIADVDASGNITWGNGIPLNTGDYQIQTTIQDAGKVLTGGAVAGTFGESLSIDTVATLGSNNLITSDAVFKITSNMFLEAHPVLSIYMTTAPDESTPAQMAAKHGGTWTVWGAGRTPVGVGTSDRAFAIGENGGASTHLLTAAQSGLVGHNHTQNAHGHILAFTDWGTLIGVPAFQQTDRFLLDIKRGLGSGEFQANGATATNIAVSAANASQAHNNIQPYETCYMYQRSA